MAREFFGRFAQSSVTRTSDSNNSPTARTSASEPGGPAIWSDAASPSSARAARKRESRPAQGVERQGEADRSLPELEVVGGQRGRDELERGRQQEIHVPQRGPGTLGVLGSRPHASLEVGICHLEAALDLRAHVVPVGVLELGEEIAVDIRDFAHEDDADLAQERKIDLTAAWSQGGRLAYTRVHKRICVVEPRDPHLDVPERLELERLEAVGERAHHLDAAADRSRHRAAVVEARCERKAAFERDEPVAGLEADDPAAGRRDADRAPGVRAEGSVGESCRQSGSRASARAAGHPTRERRVRHGSVVGVHRGDPVGELVQVRLPDVCVAGRFEPGDRLGRLLRHVVGVDDRAVRGREAGRVEDVLDGEAHAVRDRFWPRQEDSRRDRIGRFPSRGGGSGHVRDSAQKRLAIA